MATILDMLQEKANQLQSTDSAESTTRAVAEQTPVIGRLTALMDYIMKDVRANPNTSRRAQFFMKKISEEAMSELSEAPAEVVEDHFQRMASAMYWVATGQRIENMEAPIGFWDFVGLPEPNVIESAQRLAIEGSKNVE